MHEGSALLVYLEKAFTDNPCTATAGAYLRELMNAENEGLIGNDQFLDGLAEIRNYLESR